MELYYYYYYGRLKPSAFIARELFSLEVFFSIFIFHISFSFHFVSANNSKFYDIMMTAILERGEKRPIVFEQRCSNVSIRVVRFHFFRFVQLYFMCLSRGACKCPLLPPSTISNNRLGLQ